MAMQDRDPLAMLLAVSRVAGLAPYDSVKTLRVSRAALIYSYTVHIILSMASLAVRVIRHHDTENIGYSVMLWILNITILEIIDWVAVVRGPKNLRTTLFVLKHVKQTCRSIKYNDTRNVAQRRMLWIFVLMVSAITALMLFTILTSLNYEIAVRTCSVVLFEMKGITMLLLTAQFVFLAMKINHAMQGINKGIEQLYKEMCLQGGLEKLKGYMTTVPNDVTFGVHFINVKPKLVATFDHDSAPVRLRSLAREYVSMCDLARELGHAAGGMLFQIITFSILNFIQAAYFSIMLSDQLNKNRNALTTVSTTAMNSFIHIIKIFLLVAPCHDFAEELENTRFLVSHISCDSTCSAPLRAELDVFLIHLKTNQPTYSALGMFKLGRPLLLTMAAFIVTYLALLLGL